MEEQNNFNEEQVRQEISAEVRAELNSLGARILTEDEVGARDMTRLVNRFKNAKIDYDKECDRINNRYKEDIANEKIKVLDYDFKLDKASYEEEIDKIIEADQQRRLNEAQRLQADKNYKADKKECFEMLALLKNAGAEIPDDMFMSFINPLIQAKDTKGLEVAKLLAGTDTNQYICDRATDTINSYFNNDELRQFGDSAKQFILNNESEMTLALYMSRFEQMLRK